MPPKQSTPSVFRVADLRARKPTRFNLSPDVGARALLANELDILSVKQISFTGELRPTGRTDWLLEADLAAQVTQACVVTLAPVKATISEHVVRRYIAGLTQPEGDEIEMPEDENAEPLAAVIDVGAVMAEALALALPLYPRAPDADAALPEQEAPEKPFAGLADLLRNADPDRNGGS